MFCQYQSIFLLNRPCVHIPLKTSMANLNLVFVTSWFFTKHFFSPSAWKNTSIMRQNKAGDQAFHMNCCPDTKSGGFYEVSYHTQECFGHLCTWAILVFWFSTSTLSAAPCMREKKDLFRLIFHTRYWLRASGWEFGTRVILSECKITFSGQHWPAR